MNKRWVALVVVLVLLVVGGGYYYYSTQQAASPSALVGDYVLSDGGPTLVQVTAEGGGYYVAFENNGVPGN